MMSGAGNAGGVLRPCPPTSTRPEPPRNHKLARFVGTQAAIPALETRIGNVISAIAAMGAWRDQLTAADARNLVALLAAIIRRLPRNLADFLAHHGLLLPSPTQGTFKPFPWSGFSPVL